MNSEKRQILIDKYFTKSLSEEERKEFNFLKESDKEFQKLLKAENLIYNSLLYDEIKGRVNAVSNSNKSKKSNFIDSKWLGIAASILVITVFSVFAAQKAGWIDLPNIFSSRLSPAGDRINNETDSIKDIKAIDSSNNFLNYDSPTDSFKLLKTNKGIRKTLEFRSTAHEIRVNKNKTNTLATGTGLIFNLHESIWNFASTKDDLPDSVKMIYQEVLDPESLGAQSDLKTIKVFKLTIDNIEDIRFSSLYPVTINLKLSSKDHNSLNLLYGGNNDIVTEWKLSESISSNFVSEPTQMMDEYQMYIESLNLIDSIQTYYGLRESYYELNLDSTIRFKKSFIEGRKEYVKQYQESPDFYQGIEIAKRQWDIYNSQRNIIIRDSSVRRNDSDTYFYVTKPGWYAIVD